MYKQFALSTKDNPFNPFEDFRSWYNFDIEKGYDSSSKLMRIANLSDEMTEIEVNDEIERAIDRIIELDPLNIFKKVTKNLTFPEDLEEMDDVDTEFDSIDGQKV